MSQSQGNADESGSTQEGWGYGVWHWVWLLDEQARGSGMLTELLQRERCMILGSCLPQGGRLHEEGGAQHRGTQTNHPSLQTSGRAGKK